jgi:hypothetical protein
MPSLTTLMEACSAWNVRASSKEELARAQVILSHEFGDQRTMGETNWQLEKLASFARDAFGIPWISQYPQGTCETISDYAIRSRADKPGAYLNAHEVNRQAVEICRANGWTNVLLCAHPDFAWRAKKDLERFGMTVFLPDLSGLQYDHLCRRKALSSPWMFRPREVVAILVFWIRNWLG